MDVETSTELITGPRELFLLSEVRRQLAEARTIHEVKDLRDQAEIVRSLLRMRHESRALQNEAALFKIECERRAGEMLAGNVKRGGDQKSNSHDERLILSDIGISHNDSRRWQQAASVPDDIFRAYVENVLESGVDLTSNGVLKLAKNIRREDRREAVIEACAGAPDIIDDLQELIQKKCQYSCIYADPPWQYGNQGTRASTGNHYSTMPLDDICDLPVGQIAAADSHLHLWTTNAFLFDAKRVMECWGFTYKSVFVWVKPQMGIGNYWRVSHEFLLLGTRGNLPFQARDEMSWEAIDRGKHSAKPEPIREKIKRVSPGPYVELFGRKAIEEWTVFGNQVKNDPQLSFIMKGDSNGLEDDRETEVGAAVAATD